jgi:hypothetical protein
VLKEDIISSSNNKEGVMSINPELKKKKDEEASQIWIGIDPPAAQCKTCIFAVEDTEYTVGAELGRCDVYEDKPMNILWDEVECEWHVEKL